MDFVAVVDQAIALLRQRGRMTYRTLQRQFQLDDAPCTTSRRTHRGPPEATTSRARPGLDGRAARGGARHAPAG